MEYTKASHEFEPFFNKDSKLLILGSFPSIKSREQQFYYGHPQNRFWKIISALYHEKLPISIEEKKEMLKRNHIALWDVIESCEIKGSSDSSIKNVIPVNIDIILKKTSIENIYTNGKLAEKLYNKYLLNLTHIETKVLPSSSPANASYSLEKLITIWSQIIV